MQLLHSDGTPNWEQLISMIMATRGLSYEELARRLNCTESDLQDWSRTMGQPSPEIAEQLWDLSPYARVDVVAEHAMDPELMGESMGSDTEG